MPRQYPGGGVLESFRDSEDFSFFTGVATEVDQLEEQNQKVRVTAPASGESIINMPPVEVCNGRIYHIKCVGGAGTVTLRDYTGTDITLTDASNALANGEEVLLISVYDAWVVIKDTTA